LYKRFSFNFNKKFNFYLHFSKLCGIIVDKVVVIIVFEIKGGRLILYEIGELIVYGGEGVCKVESIGVPQLTGGQKTASDRPFYTLVPLYRTGKIFTPVDGKAYMRPVISRDEAIELVKQIPSTEAQVYENKNLRFLVEQYQEVIAKHNCADLVKLIKAVYVKRMNAIKRGKKLGQIDERYMKRAEDMLYGELSVSLDVPRDDIVGYISNAIKTIEAGEEWNG
jgi:CarD family transcriptional regulator